MKKSKFTESQIIGYLRRMEQVEKTAGLLPRGRYQSRDHVTMEEQVLQHRSESAEEAHILVPAPIPFLLL